jgi:hypothetical protein
MARLLGPDAGSRPVVRTPRGRGVLIYTDAAATTLASIATYDGTTTVGATITGSKVRVDRAGRLPRFWFPDGVDILYAKVAGTPAVWAINADYDARMDALRFAAGNGFSALKAALADGSRSVAVQVLGDSTGNDGNEWVRTWAPMLAAQYPAFTVHHRIWDDTSQAYGAELVLQTGTAGLRYLDCSTGSTTRKLNATASPHLSGVIDVRIKVNLADWTPVASSNLCGRSSGAGARGWYFLINTSGLPTFVYSVDGTALVSVFGSATGITDGTTSWLRAVFTPNDGGGNHTTSFYKSTDGVTWTQIGSTITTAGALTLFDPGVGYEIGGSNGGVFDATLKVFEVSIAGSVGGASVVPRLPDLWPPYNTVSAQVVGAPILTFVNGSQPGANIAYLGDSTRLPKMTPNFGQLVTILSDSHNETSTVNREWATLYDTWRIAVQAQLASSPIVITAQNPQTTAAAWYQQHANRRLDLLGYARTRNFTVVDVAKAFADYGAWSANLMFDSIHPNTAGQLIWAGLVDAAFAAA